jgi:hypothetical protein
MKGLFSICLLALPTIMAIAPDADAQRVTVGRGYYYWNSPYWPTHRYGPWRGGAVIGAVAMVVR